jgi:acyl-CoA synthetase (AMP-forming)/AMP-acid ligase II
MYQAAIARASGHQDVLRSHSLRVLRSSSSALPPKVMRTIEELFGIPAVEAYGMTEASHQMASNPLPPAERKAGCVGLPAGPDVSVMDEDGNLLGPHSEGEIVIKGPNVMDGYENAPEANRTSFTNGWLRTGDQGSFDADGYLTISGRLKEIINRGGEKISPREIEDVLLDHDAVEQSVAFPMPHRNLGEDIAAAVVLRNDAEATANDLRAFVREHLAAFKVPRKLLIVDEIPKGPTGKLQRLTLAETFGLDR